MTLPPGFIRSAPKLRKLLRFYETQNCPDNPILLDKLVRSLKIKVREIPFEEKHLHGVSFTDKKMGEKRIILLREGDSHFQLRKSLAHELFHILIHPGGIKYYSNDKFQFKIEEREADYGGAFLTLAPQQIEPLILNEATSLELAVNYGLPTDYIEKRAEIYLFFKEYRELNSRIEKIYGPRNLKRR